MPTVNSAEVNAWAKIEQNLVGRLLDSKETMALMSAAIVAARDKLSTLYEKMREGKDKESLSMSIAHLHRALEYFQSASDEEPILPDEEPPTPAAPEVGE